MKKNYLFLLSILFIISSNSKAQNFEWAKSFGGSSNEDGNEIFVDAVGNVYTIGNFRGTVDFDPGAGTYNLTSTGGTDDVFIHKLDAFGNFLWAKSFGGSLDVSGKSISLDPFGNIYTAGVFQGTADFDPGAGTFNLTSTAGDDIYIQKLNPSGNFLWAKSFGTSSSNEIASSITADASGNIYMTGRFQGTADFDPGAGITNLSSTGSTDIFVQKLDASGNFVWAKSFGGGSPEQGHSITLDTLGNVYTIGQFAGTTDFDPGTGITNLSSAGISDIFVQKLDPAGNFVWAKSFGGGSNDMGISITLDVNGNIYTTGYFGGTVDFDPGAGTTNLNSAGGDDFFIQKLDPFGNFVWAKSFGGNLNDAGRSITIDASGNVYTTGSFKGKVDFDPGTGTANLNALGFNDVFVQKLDASGNFVWAKSFGSSLGTGAESTGLSITLDPSGNVLTTGSFSGAGDFDPGSGTTNLSSAGGSDVFVHKMSQVGTTGITELTPGIQVDAYPNPSNGIVQISFEKAFSNVEISLTDMQGKEVYSKELNAIANEQIEIEGSPGVYFLSIRSKEGQSVIKLIKE